MEQARPARFARIGLDYQTNPSICGDQVLLRQVNYDLDKQPEVGWSPDTVNFLGRLRGRTVENLTPLSDRHRSFLVMQNGLEDGRLIRWNGRLFGLFSGLYWGDGRRLVTKNTMILMDLVDGFYLSFPDPERQKNWMPFVHKDRIYALKSTKPLVILDLLSGDVVLERAGLEEFWSGSSQLIPYQGGWLGVVHRHHSKSNKFGIGWACRDYIHAFLWLDSDFSPSLSPPFRFFGVGVEFCNGIERIGDELCLSFGVHDREAYLAWVGLDDSARKSSSKPEPSSETA